MARKFEQEVSRLMMESDQTVRRENQRKFFLENEPALAGRIREALESTGKSYVGDHTVAKMIIDLKSYRSAEYHYSYAEAVTAAMWRALQWDSDIDKSKVNLAIKKLLDYRPKVSDKEVLLSLQKKLSNESKSVEFRKKHRALFLARYVLLCALTFAAMGILTATLTDNVYLRYGVPTAVTYIYAVFNWPTQKKG